MLKPYTIICGSKKTNRDLSTIVDCFSTIVRHNKALPGYGYGLRKADIQVMNIHVYKNYQNKMNAKQLISYYSSMNICEKYIQEYVDYIYGLNPDNVVHYPRNNQSLMEKISKDKKLNISNALTNMKRRSKNGDTLHLRCGMGHVAQCINENIKPWLIGYSLDKKHCDHSYNRKEQTGAHDIDIEISLIKELHSRGLIDASLCCINKDGRLENHIELTVESKEIYYGNIC